MDDKVLIHKIQRGQTELLNVIAEKYYDDIYRFCFFMTGQREDSYDLAQETFLKFIKYVDHYKYKNLKGYLLTIARNLCIDDIRNRSQSRDREVSEGADILENAASGDDISELVQKHFLRSELGKLPDMQREALILYYYNDLKVREIAAITGVSISTVKSRLKQGTEKLKKQMEKGLPHLGFFNP